MHSYGDKSVCRVEDQRKPIAIPKITAVDQTREGLKMMAVLGKVASKLSKREEVIRHRYFNELYILNQSIIVHQLSTLYNTPRFRHLLKDAGKVEPLKDNQTLADRPSILTLAHKHGVS